MTAPAAIMGIVIEQNREQFSAKIDQRGFFGPITEAPVSRVRDVIVCATDPSYDASDGEYQRHPPIGSPILFRQEGSAPPVDLGRGVRIDRLSAEDAELVMHACTPRGHYFSPIRQFGQRYSLVRDVDLGVHEEHPFRWDHEGVLWDALALSRLVRDNAYSTEYAARVADHEDGMQTVVYTLAGESKHVYRLRRDREWLDSSEGAELRDLLAVYWAVEPTLPSRVRRANWRTEYASWLKWGDLAIATLVGGLEALLKTERHGSTRQFVGRVPALAQDVGIDGIDGALCERIYDARSDWVHGAHVQLFTTGQEAQEMKDAEAQQGPQTPQQWNVFDEIVRMQDVLRGAVRRCFQDDEFRATFAEDERIRSRWPI